MPSIAPTRAPDVLSAVLSNVNASSDSFKSPLELKGSMQITRHLQVLQAAYLVSETVFDYQSHQLGQYVLQAWNKAQQKNALGVVPVLHSFEARAGAATAVMGYLREGDSDTSVLATSDSFKLMGPVLRNNQATLASKPIVFHVAALAYDFESGELKPDYDGPISLAKSLGLPVLVSNMSTALDTHHTALLASVLAKQNKAVVHVYDGTRGVQQAVYAEHLPNVSQIANLDAQSSLDAAFAAVNKIFNTQYAPLEYYGSRDAKTLLVTQGVLPFKVPASSEVAVLNMRLASVDVQSIFRLIPRNLSRVVVLGQQHGENKSSSLYKTISTLFNLRSDPGNRPKLSEIKYATSDSLTPQATYGELGLTPETKESGLTAVLFDSDKSSTCKVPALLAKAATLANTTVDATVIYDNLVQGGAIETQVRFDTEQKPYRVAEADIVVVAKSVLASNYDSVERIKDSGHLVVVASTVEELEKIFSARQKKLLVAKKVNVHWLDLTLEGITDNPKESSQSMALQAAFWKLAEPQISLDKLTSKIVHANGEHSELLAVTINTLVRHVTETALHAHDTKGWADIAEEAEEPVRTAYASFNAFEAAPEIDLEEDVSAKVFDHIDTSKRVAFQEAYGEVKKLRPDLPVKTFTAKVKLNQRVTPDTYDRHIFQLELDISGTGLTYAIGEALGVHASNNVKMVQEFIDMYKLDDTQVITIPNRDDPSIYESKTVFQVLRDNLDVFGKVPKRFYEALANYATDDAQKAALTKLASPEGAADLKERTEVFYSNYMDVLSEFDSARPGIEQLAEMIAPLKRREYSIASSQKMHPNEVHLLIVVVDWKNKAGSTMYGQTSKYLADLDEGAEVTVSVKQSVMKLPKDPKTPVIMAGLGTGLAPFKAFLEEKQYQRDHGHEIGSVFLFLGSRHQREEYLYGELFEAYKAAGILTHIGAAFSRDQPEKIYIQHRIQQAKEELIEAFVRQSGNFYLCGPTWPVPDISAALSDIVVTEAAERNEKVDEARLIEDLKEHERYILEVY